jgi:AraC-like DNA-binding protein
MNFREFLGSYRIDYAKHLLSDSKDPFIRILDVALESGFSSINSFNRCFKEVTGMTPSEYRKQEALLNMR